jgi:hypothetical protein
VNLETLLGEAKQIRSNLRPADMVRHTVVRDVENCHRSAARDSITRSRRPRDASLLKWFARMSALFRLRVHWLSFSRTRVIASRDARRLLGFAAVSTRSKASAAVYSGISRLGLYYDSRHSWHPAA